MRQVLSDERWQAMRDMFEVYGVPYRLLSLTAGVNLSTVRSRGLHHNWTVETGLSDEAGDADALLDAGGGGEAGADAAALQALAGKMDRPAELAGFLLSQVEGLLKGARSGRIDKARIDAIWSMIRMVEKAEELARDTALDQQKRSDEELAGYLQRINDRIVELAEHYARELVARQSSAG
jgi:hypothetical protein